MAGETEMLETQGDAPVAPSPRHRVQATRDPDELATALEGMIRDRVLPMSYALAGSTGHTGCVPDRQLEAVIAELDELARDLRGIAVELRHRH